LRGFLLLSLQQALPAPAPAARQFRLVTIQLLEMPEKTYPYVLVHLVLLRHFRTHWQGFRVSEPLAAFWGFEVLQPLTGFLLLKLQQALPAPAPSPAARHCRLFTIQLLEMPEKTYPYVLVNLVLLRHFRTHCQGFRVPKPLTGFWGVEVSKPSTGFQRSTGFWGSDAVDRILWFWGSDAVDSVLGFWGSDAFDSVLEFWGSDAVDTVLGFWGSDAVDRILWFGGSNAVDSVLGFWVSEGKPVPRMHFGLGPGRHGERARQQHV
jgi:hypothetical protein